MSRRRDRGDGASRPSRLQPCGGCFPPFGFEPQQKGSLRHEATFRLKLRGGSQEVIGVPLKIPACRETLVCIESVQRPGGIEPGGHLIHHRLLGGPADAGKHESGI